MSTEPSRNRTGDKSSEDPPSKIPLIPDVDQSPAPYDVVLTVKGQKFYCMKEKLAEHSIYFEKMFFTEFAEKNKEEVDMGEIEPDVFQLFIDAINGIDSMTDEYSEVALVAAIFLGSNTFEDKILKHLAENSEITLQEQFEMAEDYKSHKLMIQVCASIKDAYELDEVVPKDLDSFCNATKNLVMQRSFELLGIRKPPSPPLPEEPDQVFEHMMNQIIDQVEVLNNHEHYVNDAENVAARISCDDPLIKELTNQLQNVHEQSERNFIQAQIQVLKWKDIYAKLQNRELITDEIVRDRFLRRIPGRLIVLSKLLSRDELSRSRSPKVTQGNREIDEIYRRITAEAMEQNEAEPPRNMHDNAEWLQCIDELNMRLERFPRLVRNWVPRPRPNNPGIVSNRASFRLIDEYVSNARNFYYTSPPRNEPDANGAANMDREIEA